ncbi:MAG: radical SAM/SPASM domain-containing protein [Bacteroidota bacterium]
MNFNLKFGRVTRKGAKLFYENLPWFVRDKIREAFPNRFVPPLYMQLPLSVPHSLHIDPTNLCNFRCIFCPTGDFELLKTINRPKGVMRYELFCKIIDELAEMCAESRQRVNELHLYKDGEPLIHKELGRMISYAKDRNAAHSIQTTTNAALLTKERANELLESGLDVIRVSIEHVDDNGYGSITQNYSDYNVVKENVRYLFEEKVRRKSPLVIKTKIVDVNFDKETIKKFYDDFALISDQVSVNNLMGWSNSDVKDFTLGIKVKRGMGRASKLRDKKVCPEPFRSLAINFNGQVSVCCVDWAMETIVGDLSKETLNDIWNGEKIKKFRLLHLDNKRDQVKACGNCHYLKGFPDHLYLDDKVGYLNRLYNNPNT